MTTGIKFMKLQQGQTWKTGEVYLRIVHLERLEVEYKAITNLLTKEGTHHHVTKKEFCRLLKNASLLPASELNPDATTMAKGHSTEFPDKL